MSLDDKKLTQEETDHMIRADIRDFSFGQLILHPIYVWLKRNKKFVCLKRPIDFISNEDLARLKNFELVFLHPCFAKHENFRKAAGAAAFRLKHRSAPGKLPDPPFQISNDVLKILLPLWEVDGSLDQIGVSVFVDLLCKPISMELMNRAREDDLQVLELGILRSSWVVFMSLTLGYCDLPFLSALRERVFRQTIEMETPFPVEDDVDDVSVFAGSFISDLSRNPLKLEDIADYASPACVKFMGRMERLKGGQSG